MFPEDLLWLVYDPPGRPIGGVIAEQLRAARGGLVEIFGQSMNTTGSASEAHPSFESVVFARSVLRAQERFSAAAGADIVIDDRRVPLFRVGRTGIIEVRGIMTRRTGIMQMLNGGFGTQDLERAARVARMSEDIDTLITVIDSPGGSVSGLKGFAGEIALAGKTMKTITAVDGMMASAALFVGSQSNEVVASADDMVGSIGARFTLFDISKAFEDAGFRTIVVDSAPEDRPHKSVGEIGTEISDVQIAEFQKIVNVFFADFRAHLQRGRAGSMTAAQIDAIADGRMFVVDAKMVLAAEKLPSEFSKGVDAPQSAVGLGLVDKVRPMFAVLEDAVRREEVRQSRDRQRKMAAVARTIVE